jgi:rod shape-determining protein MreD
MPRNGYSPQYILLPASPWFIAFTLLLSLALNFLPLGRVVGMPDWVALSLVFWNIHQPRRVGMFIAFLMGLAMDVNDATVFGQHALAYTLLSYGAIALHRRVQWFSVVGQMPYVLSLLVVAQLAVLAVRLLTGGTFPGGWYFFSAIAATALWPVVVFFYFAPQRRAVDRDDHRPL